MEIIRWKINSAHKKGTKNYFWMEIIALHKKFLFVFKKYCSINSPSTAIQQVNRSRKFCCTFVKVLWLMFSKQSVITCSKTSTLGNSIMW
jgi:hypothetical protein